MKAIFKTCSVLVFILFSVFLSFAEEGGIAKLTPSGGLFITKEGKAFNGSFDDEFIKVLTASGVQTISSNAIISIYRDKSRGIRLKEKEGVLWGKLLDNIRIRTMTGIVTIVPEAIVFFDSTLLEKSYDTIAWVDIIEPYTTEVLTLEKPVGKIDIVIVSEYWLRKAFTLSDPIYPNTVDPTESTKFTLNVIKHSDINDKIITILRVRVFIKNKMDKIIGSLVSDSYNYDLTPSSIPEGEAKKVILNVTFDHSGRSKSFQGNGYVNIFVVHDSVKNKMLNQHFDIYNYNTISNVVRVPVEFKNN